MNAAVLDLLFPQVTGGLGDGAGLDGAEPAPAMSHPAGVIVERRRVPLQPGRPTCRGVTTAKLPVELTPALSPLTE